MGVSKQMEFNPEIKYITDFAQFIPNEAIKNEPMFFNSSLEYAYEHGSSITRSFIDALPVGWKKDVVFDSRVHMLMPGWYPAIPGWHHDDVPRPLMKTGEHSINLGQPDYDNPRYRSEHIMGLVNADICPTKFLRSKCILPAIPDGELIYRRWHNEIEFLVNRDKAKTIEAKDRTLIYFNCDTFHTGVAAKASGWRWFGRVSKNTERVQGITNEIRVNAQVYLEFPMEGW